MLPSFILSGPSFFEILSNGFEAVSGIFYFVSYALLAWASYRFMMYIVYYFMRDKLSEKNLDEFIQVLGDGYFFKKLGDGDKRYRWAKWYVLVKANFDSEGNAIYTRLEPFKFWHYTSVVSFI
jgi:hypothetical protein